MNVKKCAYKRPPYMTQKLTGDEKKEKLLCRLCECL